MVESGVINYMCLLTALSCKHLHGIHPIVWNLRVVKLGNLQVITGQCDHGEISKYLVCSGPEHNMFVCLQDLFCLLNLSYRVNSCYIKFTTAHCNLDNKEESLKITVKFGYIAKIRV